MHPQDSASVVKELGKLFELSPTDRNFLEIQLEAYAVDVVKCIIERHARETSSFDRGRFFNLVREEQMRRKPSSSQSAEWRKCKEQDQRQTDEALERIPQALLPHVIDSAKKKYAASFSPLKGDPLQSDFGRALVVTEWKQMQGAA
jgi:hypothetical protein